MKKTTPSLDHTGCRLVTYTPETHDVFGRPRPHPKSDRFRVEGNTPGQFGVLILTDHERDGTPEVLFWLHHADSHVRTSVTIGSTQVQFISPNTTPDYFRYPRSAFRRS